MGTDTEELIGILKELKLNYRRRNEQDTIYRNAIDDAVAIIKIYSQEENDVPT